MTDASSMIPAEHDPSCTTVFEDWYRGKFKWDTKCPRCRGLKQEHQARGQEGDDVSE